LINQKNGDVLANKVRKAARRTDESLFFRAIVQFPFALRANQRVQKFFRQRHPQSPLSKGFPSTPRVKLSVGAFDRGTVEVGVNLRGGDIGVTQHFLNHAEVGAPA
jgi:hypothetical protein